MAREPQRILVIRLMHHGDVLLTTPLFSALKRHLPGAEIDALVYAETVPIISPAEFGTMVKKETAEWKKVIHDAGLSFD